MASQEGTQTPTESATPATENNAATSNTKAKKGLAFEKPKIAPLNIPFERRIQTLTVLIWVCTQSFCIILSLVLLFPFFLLMAPYLIWIWFIDKAPYHGGRPSKWFKNLTWWKHFTNFFPVHLHKSADLDPKKPYIFGYHPHGIISIGAFANFATEATGFSQLFPGLTVHLLTLTTNFKIPFFREYLMALGIADVSRQSCNNMLKKNESICIVIGGADEALDAREGTFDLTIQKRKGFARLALVHGAPLVPVLSFGENDLFDQVDNPRGSFIRKIQEKLQTYFGFSLPLFHGRGIFIYNYGFLPYRRAVHTIVGNPIEVTKVPEGTEPSAEQIEALHNVYCDRLKDLFNEHKTKYGYEEMSIRFVK